MRRLNVYKGLFLAIVLISCKKMDHGQTQVTDGTIQKKDSATGSIIVYQTAEDASKKMYRELNLTFNTNPASSIEITVDPNTLYQHIQGVGMALTGSAAYTVKQLPTDNRTALLTDIFGDSGMKMNMLRVTIGASDYSTTEYTYDDQTGTNTDNDLSDFALKGDDLNYVIPVLQEIKTIKQANPNLYVMGSPWSAPAWMKKNNLLKQAVAAATDSANNQLKYGYYLTWANYLTKYVEAMAASPNNITINAITPQNEPRTSSNEYITMFMDPQWQKVLVRDYLRQKLDEAGLTSTKIFVGDNNWSGSSYQSAIYADATARSKVQGAAFHGYAGEPAVMTNIRNLDTDKEVHMTEWTSRRDYTWANDLDNMASKYMIQPFRNWAKSVMYWNLALDEVSEPNVRAGTNYSRPVVTINKTTKAITKNVDYYVLSHVSKFIQPGLTRRMSSTDISANQNIDNVAFLNTDGWKTVLLVNKNTTAKTVDIKVQGTTNKFTYTIPARSVMTFNWN
ncbi:glycoside hydrolase family 30 beta sandwich domain-containing protein [Mucilaginibacter sp. PAMB04274]|uniref:glycoside hydrolase family 30 protein n=1 Tax=Mucilaginibacter sp. PAMB04274 TaxID=3138568 RepID=UPI0031F70261